jgi:heme oxygenase
VSTSESALAHLDAETSDLHRLAEQHVRIVDGDASVVDYERYLRAMYGFHAPLEEFFAVSRGLAAIGFEPHLRMRAHLLARDLRAVGSEGPWLHCTAIPSGERIPQLLGIAYVLERSTLDGRAILAKLPPALEPVRASATRFLASHGTETEAYWRRFGGIIEDVLATTSALDQAVTSARETFACLVQWLALHEDPDVHRPALVDIVTLAPPGPDATV